MLAKGRAPNYRLKTDFKELPQHSFVNPISLKWVPEHLIEEAEYFNPEREVFCYTAIGTILIPKEIIEETY